MQVRRKSWKTDVAMLLTLVMLFSPILSGLDAAWLGVATKAAAQQPSPTPSPVQPILVVPLKAAEGVPANIAGRMTYALVSELTASKRYSPTRLSVEDPTIQRLISENLLSQDAVAAVIEEPTPEGIAEIAAAMKVPFAAYGTVDSYTYDPSNGGSVKVQVTVRFLTIDLETVSVVEEKTVEITEEGSSAPKLKPTPEDTLAAEAIYDAAKKIVAKLIGLPPKPPVEIRRPPAVNPVAFLLGALVIAAALSGARGKAGPVPPGPADAPRSVSAVPQVDIVVVSWQPPTRGTPVGYYVYRQTVDLVNFQPVGGIERLTAEPVRTTIYEDKTAQRDRAYIYSVSAVYPDGRESVRISANLGIISPTQPAPVGIGVPLPPANLTAQARDAAVLLTWTDLNPAGLVVGYRVYRNGVQIADETTVRTTTYMDRGLQNNVVYQYVVRAVSSFGLLSAPSATVTASPGNLSPQAPLNLTARFDPTTKTVTLTWQAPPDPDVAYYEVARVVVPETRMTRGLIERARQPVPTPSTSPTIIQRVLQANPRMRQQAGSEFDANVIASDVRTTTYIDSVANFMPTPANALTRYQHLRYAVRAVDTSGQKGAWSNVVEVTPNTPPPALTIPPRLIPGNGQIIVDLQPLLEQAQTDPEWQIDKAGVRIFRVTTKGGTSATTLRPIHSDDVLPIPADGKYVDQGVVNGTRYYYAVELVDKLGVPGKRSPEAVATPFATAALTITPQGNRRELSGNGQDTVQLTITALDAASRPVAGLPLKVTLQGVGTLTIAPQYDDPYSADPSDAITDENGQVVATYQSAVISADTTVTITAAPSPVITGVSPAQLTLTLRAPVVASVEIQPQQTQLVADGQSFTRVTITVRDRLGSPMPNQTVVLSVSPAQGRFEDLNGNPITQVSTGTTGVTEVIYRSGTRAGSVTLTAAVGAISGQAVITLIPGSPATIDLVATPTTAPADGQTEIRITATVRDANGNAVPNVQVQFSSVPPLNITLTTVTTDSTGQATTSVIAPTQSGTYTLMAKVGAISKSISLEFFAGAASTIALSAERTQLLVTLPARYGSTDYSALSPFSRTIITAAVRDENDNPVRGAVVQFQTNYGIIQATATTNDQGIAQAVFNAPSVAPPGPVTITAQSGGATASLDLTVIPGPPAKVRMSASPLALPADGRTQSQLQIEVRDANDNLVSDGTQVQLTLNPNIGSIQSPVATVNGIATSVYIPSTQTGEVTITAIAERSFTLDGQEYRFATDPNDPYSTARVRIFVGAQIQIVRTAPNFRTEVSVSSSPSDDPAQRKPLRTRPPVENTSDLTLQLVDGQGNNIATSGVQIRVRANDSQVLLVELQGGQENGNLSLQELTVLTDSSGRASVRYYASPIAGNVQVTAELLDPQGVAFTSDMVTITQRPGDPAIITVPTPSPNLIFVPGAGTPIQTTITAQVFDSVNNPVESGISVRFEANLMGRSVGVFTPTTALTDSNGQASSTLTSTLDTGIVTVTATASVPGQQTPATGSNTVSFVTDVTQITVTARDSRIGGADDDNIPDSTLITANFTGTIPNGTRVVFTTTRGTFDPESPVPVRQQVVAVTNNTAQVTLYKETVAAPVIATVQVSVLNAQGQPVTGSVDVTIVPVPGPIELQLEVAQSTLVVSNTNEPVPAQRQPLDPNKPNSTAVTVSVFEQETKAPVPNTAVTLSSSDNNTLWVVGDTARVGQIVAQTDSNGKVQATFYTSTKAGEVTITATIDLGGGNTLTKQATITQEPGPPVLTVTTDKPEIFVRLPDNFNGFDYSQLPRSAQVTAKVADANGNPYKDIVVNFSASDGIITSAATTDANGEAKVDYSPPDLMPADGQVTITAQITVNGNQISGQTTLRVRPGPPAQISIVANPPELPSDGRSTSVITATVKDANGNDVRDGTKVTFELQPTIPQGTTWLPNRENKIEVSTVNGQAQATLLAGTQAGTANIKVSAEEIINGQNYKPEGTLVLPIGIILQPIQVSQANLFVSRSNYSSFGVNYPNEAEVTVEVNPATSGVKVVLSASDAGSRWKVNGGLKESPIELTTGNDGKATAIYVASQRAGQVTIEARMGNQVQTVTINQLPGPPQVTITANPERVFVRLAGSQYQALPQQSEITVKVADENGNPHENAAVQLTTTGGTLAESSGQTDSQGQFTTTLTAPTQVPTGGKVTITANVTTTRGERPDPQTKDVTVQPGPPAIVELTATKLTLSASDSADITATVKDANGNPVPSGNGRTISVAFTLQHSAANSGKVNLNPTSGNTDNQGKVTATLTTTDAVADSVTINAEAVETLQATFFRASSSLSLSVGVTPIFLSPPEILDATTLVVSSNNDINPNNRQPLDPEMSNRTRVRIRVSNTGGQPLPVTFISSDDNSLWQDAINASLKSLTTTLDAQGEAVVWFYASSKKGSVQIKVQMNGQETPSVTIQQVAGLPASIVLTSDKAVVPQGSSATITATVTDNASPQPNRVRQGTRVSFRLISTPSGVSLEAPTDRSTADENGQVSIRLLVADNAANGVATIEARTDNGVTQTLSLPVGVSPTLQPLQVTQTTLSVSADNNPIARNPVNGAALPNQTPVKVVAQNTGGLPVQVTLSSNDDNTLWIDGATRSLKQITVTLDANGEKTVTFVASSTARQVTITASLNGQTETATITQQPGPPAQITFRSDRDIIPNNESAQLTARVVDAAAPTPNPVPNVTVNFSFVVQPAGTTLNPTSANTNDNGEAVTTLQAPATGSGQAVVQAQVTSPLNPPSPQVTVFVGLNPTLQSLSVVTPVLSVSANDNTTNPADRVNLGPEPSSTQITVQAANTGGQPIPVEFEASDDKVLWDDGTNRALGRLRTNLDANGRATVAYYTSSKVGNVQVTVRLNTPTQPTLTTVITQLPGNPATIQLSTDKQIVPPADQATITAIVKDAAGNNVRDGTQVVFQLQPGAPPDTSLLPPTTVLTQNGQAQVRLLAGTTSGQATVQATSGAANANITLYVGVSPTLAPLRVENPNLVVSDSNSTDPAQRRPLDPNAQNNTVVTVQVRGTGGQPVPIILRSNDDNTLWVNRRDTSQRALKEITINTDANGVAEAIFYASTSARTVTITAISGSEQADTVIVQKPGPPAQINLALQGFNRAPDGVPYLNIQASGTVIATVVDANGNPIPNATVNFSLSPEEGNLNPTSGITGSDGKAQTSLTASTFSTEVTLRAQTGSVAATQTIRYSVSVPGLTITANPNEIPDDGMTTSTITIESSDVNRPLPNNLKFRLSADLGATLSAGTEGTDQPNLILTVGNGQPTGEGANQAQAILKGPAPDLSQTQNRTITLTASLIVDGQPRTFTQTVTLLPRIQITSNFGLSNNPNRLVVSSSNDTDQTRRVPLDTIAGHNRATIEVLLNGSAPPNPSFVTFTSNDPNILFVEVNPSNNQETSNKALGNLSVNFAAVTDGWKAIVNLYSSTTAASNLVVQIGVLGTTRSIIFEQVSGLPAIVTVSPDRSVIGVTGHPTLPTSTAVRAIIRDAAGNLVTQPGITVTFTADAGTLNPTSAPAVNGVATTTLTSTNETRQVRVVARATSGNAEAVGAATIVFVVGSVSNITLTTDKPQDPQGRVLLDPNDLVRITATYSRTGTVPDGTIPIVTLTGAYGLIQSITPAQGDRSDVIVLNNNTTNVDQEARIRFTVYNEQGLPVSSPEQIVVMKGVTAVPVVSLTAGTTILKVSTSNDTNENIRNALNPGGPSQPTGATANRTTLTVALNITGLNANEQVTLTLSSTDLNGLFTNDATQNGETGQLGQMTINLNADGSGNLIRTEQRAYWASTKAGNFVITAEVKRQDGTVIGRASLNITQNPGNPAQVFLTTDPPRLAVSTVTDEPTAARVIATLFDANNNPVPNWWTFFQLQPVRVNLNPDITDNGGAGENLNIPSVSDGVLDPFAVRTDAGGVAVSLIRSINTCQPVRIRAIADANNDGNLQGTDGPENSYDTVYYVPLTNASAVVDYNSVTRNIIVTVTPATALPPNTAIWVCRYARDWTSHPFGNDNYAVDNDGDGRFDEDPFGDVDGDGNNNDDGDGATDEDGIETLPPIYYRVIVTEPGRLVVPAFPLGVREIGIVNVRIFIYTKDGTMLRIRIDQVQR
ncbi:MAG: hypothetical protein DFNUSKGM_000862 [Candidatus Fervidibacter sacchari]